MDSFFRKKEPPKPGGFMRTSPKPKTAPRPAAAGHVGPLREPVAVGMCIKVLSGEVSTVLPTLQKPLGMALSQMQRQDRLMPAIYQAMDDMGEVAAQSVRDGILMGRWALLLPV